jgi:single-strand DNA-binding protein
VNDIQITMPGNLVADPELRYTPNGVAVASLRIASTPRMNKGGKWVDAADTVFLDVVAWRTLGENAANELHKGDRVTVNGRLRQRSYETKDGQKRTVYEIHADDIAPSLRISTPDPAPATAAPEDAQAVDAPAAEAPAA